MLSETIIRELQLARREARSFCVSLSGGLDSTVLLHLLSVLREQYGFKLQALHLNFGLRGEESRGDEEFVRQICSAWSVTLQVKAVTLEGETAIQERARELRLQASQEVGSTTEWVEAHHADDQVETFLLRLLRGASFQGLSAMRSLSIREGQKVWRPFLTVPKKELLAYAASQGLSYREDRTNRESHYDRNFLRNDILPLLDHRFPHFRKSLLRTVQEMQFEEERRGRLFRERSLIAQVSESPLCYSMSKLDDLSFSERCDFLHRLLKEKFGITLSQAQTFDLESLVSERKKFTFNAPKGLILRGAMKEERLLIEFCMAEKPFQRLGVTNDGMALY